MGTKGREDVIHKVWAKLVTMCELASTPSVPTSAFARPGSLYFLCLWFQSQLCILLALDEVGAAVFQDTNRWEEADSFLDKRLSWHHCNLSCTIRKFKARFAEELDEKDCKYLDLLQRYRNSFAHCFFALDDLIDKDRMQVEHYHQRKPNEVTQVHLDDESYALFAASSAWVMVSIFDRVATSIGVNYEHIAVL